MQVPDIKNIFITMIHVFCWMSSQFKCFKQIWLLFSGPIIRSRNVIDMQPEQNHLLHIYNEVKNVISQITQVLCSASWTIITWTLFYLHMMTSVKVLLRL